MMKAFLSIVLALLMVLPLLVSCGEAPADSPASSPVSSDEESRGTEPATEPVSEPSSDPFEEGDPLPEDLAVPECLKTKEGTVLGTIVLPKAAEEDGILKNAAQDLQYHLKKVLGADFAIVSRPGEGYGSIILATPDTLPAITEMFADDLAWLADLGSKEAGKWASDGFAIRQYEGDIYVIGNISKGTLNGVYDLIEDNLGVIWARADEEKGLFYDELDEATIEKVDYREKSPFQKRGFLSNGDYSNILMAARNKTNMISNYPDLGMRLYGWGHSIMMLLTTSPIYDPEETEYWETDAEGNSLDQAGSMQVNPWSDKVAEVIAANIIAQMEADPEVRFVFIGEEDRGHGRVVPYDTEPFEYAPGQFVQPEDRNFYSTVFHTMINKIARSVKEAIPDGWVGTFAYNDSGAAPACDIEDNIMICLAPGGEDYTYSILDPAIRDRVKDPASLFYCEDVPAWGEKASSLVFWHYYICNAQGTEYGWPIWYRIQEDFQGYMKMGVDGVTTDGLPDMEIGSSWLDYNGAKGNCANYWEMNILLCWIYQKLLWNPYEDIPTLMEYFCDKVYGEASPYMQEYYHLLEQGFREGATKIGRQTAINLRAPDFYRIFVYKPGIGHELVDALDKAYNAASGSIKEDIKYMYDCVYGAMSAYKSF